jgi:low temperature requirement protein LtrA
VPLPSDNGSRYLGAGGTFRLEPPRLRTTGDANEERHATWFELFFDLVFAAAVGQLGSGLARDPSAVVFARFLGLFVVIAWIWVLYTMYTNRFDTDDLIFRLSKSGAMLTIAAIAVDLHRILAGHGGTAEFAVGCVVLRVLLLGLYGRARRHVDGEGRRVAEIYIGGYGSTTVVWLVSIVVPTPYRYVLWTVAMVFDLVFPVFAWRTLTGHSVVTSHLTERFGTFFIVMLGESVAAAVGGGVGRTLDPASWVVALAGFVIALSLWWVYFDLADTSVVGRGALGLVYVYSHFPLLAGVVVFGEGMRLAIIDAARGGALTAGTRWALAGGIGAFALSLAVIHLGAEWTSLRDRTFVARICVAVLCVIFAATGGGATSLELVVPLTVVVLTALLLEANTPKYGAATVVQLSPATAAAGAGTAPPDAAADVVADA